ncbi:MAG: NAD(+) diphosphatase [Gammaproteobacteria bacterium]|nr:NAD(+) diphosphatase [Gammaproteobacteria bacterium]
MPKLILFANNNIILTNKNEFIDFTDLNNLDNFSPEIANLQLIDLNFDDQYVALELPEEHFTALNHLKITSLRSILLDSGHNNELERIKLITRARQLVYWANDHKFCGRCGAMTVLVEREHAKECKNCGLISYPRISPCVLGAVIKNNEILLGRSAYFPPGVYSLLAGFVEVGESAEETVIREIYEESRIEVTNLRYFGSQPWPFPHSLMLAYIADYKSGEIIIDKNELEDVRWFNLKNLRTCPDLLPAKGSLSRMLLDYLIF